MNVRNTFILLFVLSTAALWGQMNEPDVYERLTLDPDLTYDKQVQSPEQFLGYQLGKNFTVYAKVEAYFQQLARSSKRVIYNEYGQTYEGRPLINLVITSEANQQNLDQIQKDHFDKLVNAETKDEAYLKSAPVFTSISYNIHGNEASGTEAAMQVAYRLAAAMDKETKDILDNSVILLFICINPDGRDRYVYWYKSMKRIETPGVEPRDLEHYAPWPNGRTNHYWFDLNRDWIWGIHPESRGHTGEYQKWMPQVHVDYHEMGYNSNYFTMPGTTPRNKLLPDTYEALSDTFGMANVRMFDANQLNYYTRDVFDFFYPGYGSSYPSVMGAIGMLVEQGGIAGGLGVKNEDGYVLTLRQRVFDHYNTSMATIKKSAEMKEVFLGYSADAWQSSSNKTNTKAYILPKENNDYLKEVLAVLQRNNVELQEAQDDFSARVTDYRSGASVNKNFVKGSYIVSTDQPRHLFVTSIMERNMTIEDSVMYDMATWSAPLAYNLEAYATSAPLSVRMEMVKEVPTYTGMVNNPKATYAYVIEWKQRYAPKALAMLWKKGYRVRSATEPFTTAMQSYGEGSLVILLGRNLHKTAQEVVADMQAIAEAAKVTIDGMNSGRMKAGMDLGSNTNQVVKQPRVALMIEPPFNTYSCGQLYYLFDQETRLPVERVRTSILQQTDAPKFGSRYGYANLDDYDVLILPDGGGGLSSLFGKQALQKLQAWVRSGGVLVASESAAPYFTAKRSKMTKVELHEIGKDTTEAAALLSYKDREDYYGKKRIPGSAMNAMLDTSNPLAFGLDKEVYSLKFDNLAFKPSPEYQTVGYYDPDPESLLVAGYASEANLKHLAGNTFAGVQPMGRGKVVFLLDNTQFRMFWRGPSRMMQNAVMLLPGM